MTQGCDGALAVGRGIDEDQCGRVAYDATYLGTARVVLARMLDYAVNVLGYRLASFWALFLANDVSRFLLMETRRLLRVVRASSWHALLCERRVAIKSSCSTRD